MGLNFKKPLQLLQGWQMPMRPGLAVVLTVGLCLVHFVLLAAFGADLLSVLNHWDSWHYSRIALGESDPALSAFYPFYPLLVRSLLFTGAPPQLLGAFLSTAFFVLAVALLARSSQSPTMLGLMLLLLSPASYALHTHHTEGLFLLLSVVALTSRRWWLAGAAACLALLTRNQGVFVWFTTLGLLWSSADARPMAIRRVMMVGVLGALTLGLFVCSQWMETGDALAFLHAQAGWNHAQSAAEVFQTLALAPLWQQPSWSQFGHVAMALLLLVGGWLLWRDGKRWPSVYTVLTCLPFPLQADFGNSWRFSAVMFPLWMVLGQRLGRAPRWLQLLLLLALAVLNVRVTRAYALELWAY